MALDYIAQSSLAPLLLIATALLAAAGIGKARNPRSAMDGLLTAGVKSWSRPIVYCIILIEVGACAAVLSVESPVPAIATGALYLAFAAFVASLLLRGKHSVSCGCFGAEEMPVRWLHVALNGALAAGCIAAAGTLGDETPTAVSAIELATLLLGGGFGAYLVYVAMTLVPRMEDARARAASVRAGTAIRPGQFVVHTVNGGNIGKDIA